ncbi:hypothetical protein HFO81_22590 [Rhizobium leguminosarum]|uniref:hypothetical protein n=1 Tax=Rhizobium leguminosarum TaxID=384 RepID=UPI001C96CDFB|nr:hypothetical protein [Rhizobium leguminosarum]MBY5508326.1 hypothetical protein [Rhizobium leguminosarum]
MPDYPSYLLFDGPRRRIYSIISPILEQAGLDLPDVRELLITEKSIRETSTYDGLSRVILGRDVPKIQTPLRLDHYTEGPAFWEIIKTGELHLHALSGRLNQGEFSPFACEHGLHGYVEPNGAPKQLLLDASTDLFFASFSLTPQSDRLWDRFGNAGNGFRLGFEVTADSAADLCAIRYPQGPTLLKQINDALITQGCPPFILKGISRIGAYFLPTAWEEEKEVRLLAKRFQGGGAPVRQRNGIEIWPIPIDSDNHTASLSLKEIGVRKLDPAIVRSKLPARWAAIPVLQDEDSQM